MNFLALELFATKKWMEAPTPPPISSALDHPWQLWTIEEANMSRLTEHPLLMHERHCGSFEVISFIC